MLDSKYAYSYEGNNFYCYENSNVLINKLDIRDSDRYYAFERAMTFTRQGELNLKPLDGALDFEHLKAIHYFLFQDVFYWAGKTRTVAIAKVDLFCLPQYIDSYAQDVFGKLRKKNYLQHLDKDAFITGLADFLSDLNALHPFREGNGRTQREFIRYVAALNGYGLDYSKIGTDENIIASHDGINGNNQKLEEIIRKSIYVLDDEQTELFTGYFKSLRK